jgi:hypothetical protein
LSCHGACSGRARWGGRGFSADSSWPTGGPRLLRRARLTERLRADRANGTLFVGSVLSARGGPWRGKKKTAGGLEGIRAGCRPLTAHALRVVTACRHAGDKTQFAAGGQGGLAIVARVRGREGRPDREGLLADWSSLASPFGVTRVRVRARDGQMQEGVGRRALGSKSLQCLRSCSQADAHFPLKTRHAGGFPAIFGRFFGGSLT